MGHHATIGRSLRPAPRVQVTDRRTVISGNEMQTGHDIRIILNGVADKYGSMGATTPAIAPYDIASPALGAVFASNYARSIVVRGDWRKPSRGLWTIATQMGMVKVTGGKVFLNGEYLGQVNMRTLTSKEGKERVLTQIIAGTLTR